MDSALATWEKRFADCLLTINASRLKQAGGLLPVVPSHQDWDDFVLEIKTAWGNWKQQLKKCPSCLVVLYGGLAFYEYDEGSFWAPFARTLGLQSLSPNEQGRINAAFKESAEALGLPIKQSDTQTSSVSSAVFHIGIPISLWDDFLEVCEWALWRDDWKKLSDQEWQDAVGRRAGGRRRLKRFLIENRQGTTDFIQEVLDARKLLNDDPQLTIRDITQASILRPEYFDDVPETAEFFLRSQNPESLFEDRARLVWDEQRRRIGLYLPPVSKERFPATWQIGAIAKQASATASELVLNAQAFEAVLNLKLCSGGKTEYQRFRGIRPWGLFDLGRGGRLVNSDREQLPMSSYALLSREKIESVTRPGFDEEVEPVNSPYELDDGTTYYVTRLWPLGKPAKLQVKVGTNCANIRFRIRARIEARFLAGQNGRAALFSRFPDKMTLESLPILCIAIPRGYFDDTAQALNNKFKVFMDALPAHGTWEVHRSDGDSDKEFFFFKWSEKPFIEKKQSGTIKTFKDLPKFLGAPDLRGEHLFSITAREFTHKYKVCLERPKPGMADCWRNLPGAFLPWVLVCQSKEGLKWDDMMLAKEVISPSARLSYYLLRKCEEQGLLIQKGRYWMIGESRAVIQKQDQALLLHYCGDPSILRGVYRLAFELLRRLNPEIRAPKLPIIEVIDRRGQIPYLSMSWEPRLRDELEKYLRKHGVRISSSLWNR